MYHIVINKISDGMDTSILNEIISFDKHNMSEVLKKADMPFDETKRRLFFKNNETFIIGRDADAKLIGYIEYGTGLQNDDSIYITSFQILPEYRRSPLSLYLLSNMINDLKDQPFIRFTCNVHISNNDAIRFYKNLGFNVDRIEGNDKQYFLHTIKDTMFSERLKKVYSRLY